MSDTQHFNIILTTPKGDHFLIGQSDDAQQYIDNIHAIAPPKGGYIDDLKLVGKWTFPDGSMIRSYPVGYMTFYKPLPIMDVDLGMLGEYNVQP